VAAGGTTIEQPIVDYNVNQLTGTADADPRTEDSDQRAAARGLTRLVRVGLETFLLGFPVHFDWRGERSSQELRGHPLLDPRVMDGWAIRDGTGRSASPVRAVDRL